MSREIVKPYLIAKGEDGQFRLTVRETRYNSQGYPLVTATPVAETFKSATAARTRACGAHAWSARPARTIHLACNVRVRLDLRI